MMKKTRFFAILIAICLILSAFASCGNLFGSPQEEATTEASSTNKNQKPLGKDEEDDDEYDENDDATSDTDGEENESTPPTDDTEEDITYSVGLEFTSNGNGTCVVDGLGNCTDSNVVIPKYSPDGDLVIGIGWWAFMWNSQIESLYIPDSLTQLGSNAISKCSNLKEITVSKNNKAFKSIDGNLYTKDGKTLILYAIGKEEKSFTIPNGVTYIYSNAFNDCKLESITIPDSVTRIGENAFSNCDVLVQTEGGVSYVGKWAVDCSSSVTGVTLRNDTVGIADNTFSSCKLLIHLIIPNSIKNIGSNAFGNSEIIEYNKYDNACYLGNEENPYLVLVKAQGSDITSCEINSNTKFIYDKAFYNCENLVSIIIPNGVLSISNEAFQSCDSLTSVKISDSVISIGSSAFEWCSSLATINIPDGITNIENETFYYCQNLASITIPDSVTKIGEQAFYNCSSLLTINIPQNVESIGSQAFTACSKLSNFTVDKNNAFYSSMSGDLCSKDGTVLIQHATGNTATSFTVPKGVTKIEDYAFYGSHKLKNISIPVGVTSIGHYSFYNCNSLTSIELPVGVTSIGNFAFEYCFALTSVSIPNSVIHIGESAFYNCYMLTSVDIPASVRTIAPYAFSACSKLASITVDKDNASYSSKDGNLYSKDGTTFILYAPGKTDQSFDVPDGVISIGDRAFYDCDNLTSISLPDGVTSISYNAFAYCRNLSSINIPDSVTSIDNYAFNGDDELIQNENGVYYVDNWVIDFNSNDESEDGSEAVELRQDTVGIANSAFTWCSNISRITIPVSVKFIGYDAFSGCSNIIDVFYTGSEEDWANISISEGNNHLTDANITYSYVTPGK